MTRRNETNRSKLSHNPTSKLLPCLFRQTETIKELIEYLLERSVEHEVLNHLLLGARHTLENADYVEVCERFNDKFAAQGWIATESFSIDIMRRALELHDKQRYDEAEEVILEWFSPSTIQLLAIGRCGYYGDHTSRIAQLDEALKLTQEERYYSAVPLILIASEGFANDVLNEELFSKEAELSAFDTFVGHSSALPTLVRQLTKRVTRTSEDTANIPERHGILHGKTLGYATRSNCMKAWSLFIALTDLHIERLNEAEKPSEASIPTELSMKDVAAMLLERGERQARLVH